MKDMKMKKAHPTKVSKMKKEKPMMKLGKESFESPSPIARREETKGVNKKQKKILEHNEGPKKMMKKKKTKMAFSR